jgi:hypothetical protein
LLLLPAWLCFALVLRLRLSGRRPLDRPPPPRGGPRSLPRAADSRGAFEEEGEEEEAAVVARIVHRGEFGAGHRLARMSGAYRLARRLAKRAEGEQGTPRAARFRVELRADWGRCRTDNGTSTDVFAHLFGSNVLYGSGAADAGRAGKPKAKAPKQSVVAVRIRNDVPGYYAGQMYKNAGTPLTGRLWQRWVDKMEGTDVDLFRALLARFRHQGLVQEYQREKNWRNRFVVGVHLRLGNGERGHFAESGRGSADAASLVRDAVDLVQRYLDASEAKGGGDRERPPPALFVATDTPAALPLVRAELGRLAPALELWPSPTASRLPPAGVSYALESSDECLGGWVDAVVDQALLSRVDVLVAPARSTFTQILPRAVVLSPRQGGANSSSNRAPRRGGTFCEVETAEEHPPSSGSAPAPPRRMVCFESSADWLLRNGTDIAIEPPPEEGKGQQVQRRYLPHKVLVQLPEPPAANGNGEEEALWGAVRSALAAPNPAAGPGAPSDSGNGLGFGRGGGGDGDGGGGEATLRYGPRFAQKYREHPFRPGWTHGPA